LYNSSLIPLNKGIIDDVPTGSYLPGRLRRSNGVSWATKPWRSSGSLGQALPVHQLKLNLVELLEPGGGAFSKVMGVPPGIIHFFKRILVLKPMVFGVPPLSSFKETLIYRI